MPKENTTLSHPYNSDMLENIHRNSPLLFLSKKRKNMFRNKHVTFRNKRTVSNTNNDPLA